MGHSPRIKVSDLLLNIGHIDEVIFSDLMITSISGLDSKGIGGKLSLQSIDNSTIIATLEGIVCHIHEESDISGITYIRDVVTAPFSAYFVIDPDKQTYNEEDDSPLFPIDPKNLTIDATEMIYQCVILDTPFVKRTPEEEKEYLSAEADDMDSFDNDAGGHIVFRKVK